LRASGLTSALVITDICTFVTTGAGGFVPQAANSEASNVAAHNRHALAKGTVRTKNKGAVGIKISSVKYVIYFLGYHS
jgi:hypothetical protein